MSLIIKNSTISVEDSDINFSPPSIHSRYCKSSSYQVVATERLEEWATSDPREILSAYMVNQLSILWVESRRPHVWLVKILALFILLVDSWWTHQTGEGPGIS
jgi:hypothetical protein